MSVTQMHNQNCCLYSIFKQLLSNSEISCIRFDSTTTIMPTGYVGMTGAVR